MKLPTLPQVWVLQMGCASSVEGGHGGQSIIHSFLTGNVRYGHRTSVVSACQKAGWLDEDGRTTDAGRDAISKVEAAQ